MRKLAKRVFVDGQWWGPGPVPDEVAEKIRNPKVWASDDESAGGGEPTDGDGAREKAGTRSGARLARTVHVDGRPYGPGDQIPDEVAARIRNPRAWEGGVLPPEATGAPGGSGGQVDPEEPVEEDSGEAGRVAAPPRTGRGSGINAWRDFAAAHSVNVPENASREDIIAACENAGLIDSE